MGEITEIYKRGMDEGRKQLASELVEEVTSWAGIGARAYLNGKELMYVFQDDVIALIKRLGGLK